MNDTNCQITNQHNNALKLAVESGMDHVVRSLCMSSKESAKYAAENLLGDATYSMVDNICEFCDFTDDELKDHVVSTIESKCESLDKNSIEFLSLKATAKRASSGMKPSNVFKGYSN